MAPLKAGDEVGRLVLRIDDSVVYEGPIQALHDVAYAGFFARLWDRLLMWIDSLLLPSS